MAEGGGIIPVARGAARREALVRGLRVSGVVGTLAAGLALVGVVVARLADAPWSPSELAIAAGALVLISLVTAVVLVAGRPGGTLRGARLLDERLGLKDRLGSGLSFAGATDSGFARLAQAEGEAHAARVRVAQAIPVRLPRSHAAWVVLLGAGVALAWIVPGGDSARATPVVSNDEPTRALDESIEQIEQLAQDEALEASVADRLDALNELREEMERQAPDPRRSLEAAEALQRAADELDRVAQRLDAQDEALWSDLAETAREGGSGDESIDQSTLDELADRLAQAEELTDPTRRQAAAEEARELARRLDEALSRNENTVTPPDRAADDPLSADQRERVADDTDPDRIAQTLEDSGMDPDAARRAADQIADENQREQARERAREQIQELRDSAREAADELEQPAQDRPGQPREDADQNRPGDESREGDQQQDQQPPDRPGDSSGPNSDDGQKPSAQPSEQGEPGEQEQKQQPSTDGTRQDRPGEQAPGDADSETGSQDRPGESSPDGQGDDTSSTGQGDKPGDKPDENGQPRPGSDGVSPTTDPGDSSDSTTGQPPPGTGTSPGTQSPEPGDGAAPDSSGADRFEQAVREMRERRDAADRSRQSAQQLRERANSLLDGDADGLARGQGAGEGMDLPPMNTGATDAPPAQLEDVDVESDFDPNDDSGREIARRDRAPDPESIEGRFLSRPTAQSAADGLARDIEQQRVPQRHADFVRRVLERLSRQQPAEPSDAPPPAQDAKDSDD